MMRKTVWMACFGFLTACQPTPAHHAEPFGDARSSTQSTNQVRPDASRSIAGPDVAVVKQQTGPQLIVPERTSSDVVLVKRQSRSQNRTVEHTWCGKDGWSTAAQDAALAIQKLKVSKGTIHAKCTNPKQHCHTTMNDAKDVVLDAFQIDPDLITHAAYRACVAAKQCSPLVSMPPTPEAPNYQSMPPKYPEQACGGDPVFFAAAKQAEAYCRWRGGRLPTEPELRMAFELGIIQPPTDAKIWVEGIYEPANLGVSEILQGYYTNNSRLVAGWYDGFRLGGLNEAFGSATIGFRCVVR